MKYGMEAHIVYLVTGICQLAHVDYVCQQRIDKSRGQNLSFSPLHMTTLNKRCTEKANFGTNSPIKAIQVCLSKSRDFETPLLVVVREILDKDKLGRENVLVQISSEQ